ncbi:hypothetical protein BC940DRAFT_288227 [Gongronella butleri]|nr:hypothetical protein BC940DRAFT_288227 [Gongronella butleri]
MAFKNKQREKHGHLFGDDPLSASSTSEPTVSSSRRKDFPFDPLSASSSRSSSPNGSIFGNIDVSKLGSGKRATRSSFRLAGQDDDDQDALFGAKPASSTSSLAPRGSPKPVHASPSSPPPPPAASAPAARSTVPSVPSVPKSRSPTMHSPPPPTQTQPSPSTSQRRPPPPPPPPTRRAFSPSTSTSSSSSLLAPSPSLSTSSVPQTMASPTSPPPPPPPRTHKKHLQSLYPKDGASPTTISPPMDPIPIASDPLDDQRLLARQKAAMMEDEATRAFALDPSALLHQSSATAAIHADDNDQLAPRFDELSLRDQQTPTASVSNHSTNKSLTDEDDPWQPIVTPTASTPLEKYNHIAPAKQRAFADLIANWHGTDGPAAAKPAAQEDDPAQFFEAVASEQRDIGFAGIQGHAPIQPSSSASTCSMWQQDQLLESNPWS